MRKKSANKKEKQRKNSLCCCANFVVFTSIFNVLWSTERSKPRAHDKEARGKEDKPSLGTTYEYRKGIVRSNGKKDEEKKMGQGIVNSKSGQDPHSTSSHHPRSDNTPGQDACPSNWYRHAAVHDRRPR